MPQVLVAFSKVFQLLKKPQWQTIPESGRDPKRANARIRCVVEHVLTRHAGRSDCLAPGKKGHYTIFRVAMFLWEIVGDKSRGQA